MHYIQTEKLYEMLLDGAELECTFVDWIETTDIIYQNKRHHINWANYESLKKYCTVVFRDFYTVRMAYDKNKEIKKNKRGKYLS